MDFWHCLIAMTHRKRALFQFNSWPGYTLTSEIRGILAPIFLVLYPLYIGLSKKIHTCLGPGVYMYHKFWG